MKYKGLRSLPREEVVALSAFLLLRPGRETCCEGSCAGCLGGCTFGLSAVSAGRWVIGDSDAGGADGDRAGAYGRGVDAGIACSSNLT